MLKEYDTECIQKKEATLNNIHENESPPNG